MQKIPLQVRRVLFYQEKETRSSIRDWLFREVISNLLIHREFSNGFPARLIIEDDRVYTENWSRPHGGGGMDPANFSPYPKDPIMAKFFHEIGRVDELGSGIRNTYKYCGIYTPDCQSSFVEGDIFKTMIPLESSVRKEAVNAEKWKKLRQKSSEKKNGKCGENSGGDFRG